MGGTDVFVPVQTLTATACWSPEAVPTAPASAGVSSPVAEPFAGLVSVSAGAVVSSVKVAAALPVLPAGSVWRASTVYGPSGERVDAVADQWPGDVVAASVWSTVPATVVPLWMRTVTAPGSAASPARAGVVSAVALPSDGAVTATDGPWVSTVKPTSAVVPVFP